MNRLTQPCNWRNLCLAPDAVHNHRSAGRFIAELMAGTPENCANGPRVVMPMLAPHACIARAAERRAARMTKKQNRPGQGNPGRLLPEIVDHQPPNG